MFADRSSSAAGRRGIDHQDGHCSSASAAPALRSLSRRSRGRTGTRAIGLAVSLAVAAVVAAANAPAASAASEIKACFSFNGVRYQNLSTSVEYWTKGGYWGFLRGSAGVTESDGCVTYTIGGAPQGWYLRIRATAVVPNWRGVFDGHTPYYANPGTRFTWLGEGRLQFYYLPAAVETPPDNWRFTDDWLDAMSNGGSGSDPCSFNGAMAVACYMDAHGLHGNVVVPNRDSDGDGWYDWQDPYPQDKYRHP